MAKRAGTKPGSSTARMLLIGLALAAVVVAGVLIANRSSGDGPAEIDHVHGLGVNPADGELYVATHNGVFRLPADGQAERVGDGAQDTMGFTIAGPDRFLASGHPAPFQDGPDHLGLIESTDAGVSWQTLSLAGEADFHALRYRHDTSYGFNSVTGRFLVSPDGAAWEDRSGIELFDFAVSPTDPDLLLGTTPEGMVRSTDGGRGWEPAGGPPVVLLAWEAEEKLWGITSTGEVLASTGEPAQWSTSGQAAGAPSAFAANGDDLYLAVQDEGIFHSADAGVGWEQLYP